MATAALTDGVPACFVIVPEMRLAAREGEEVAMAAPEGAERANVAWKIVCYEAILASEP